MINLTITIWLLSV